MSPSGTMARVYQALKARVMAGAFAPGERIDPARLSADLAASATPIREALHRLAGERLVESWQQEGFRQPFVTEANLRDLYGWSEDLLRLLLRAIERNAAAPMRTPAEPGADFAAAATAAFEWMANLSPNLEHRFALASLNERSHALRRVEEALIPGARAELDELVCAVAAGRWRQARRLVGQYHAARLRRVSDLTAHLQRRES